MRKTLLALCALAAFSSGEIRAGGIRIAEDRATTSGRTFSTHFTTSANKNSPASLNGGHHLTERINSDFSSLAIAAPEILSAGYASPLQQAALRRDKTKIGVLTEYERYPVSTWKPQDHRSLAAVIRLNQEWGVFRQKNFEHGARTAETFFDGAPKRLPLAASTLDLPLSEISETHRLINLIYPAAKHIEENHISYPQRSPLHDDALTGMLIGSGLDRHPEASRLQIELRSLIPPAQERQRETVYESRIKGFFTAVAWRLGGAKARDMALTALNTLPTSLGDPYTAIYHQGNNFVRERTVSQMLPDKETGYVYLPDFAYGAAADVKNAIESLPAQKIVLDLRSNTGGILTEAKNLISLFLGPFKLIYLLTSRLDTVWPEHTAWDSGKFAHLPLAVLVDENTASASEIVADVLRGGGFYRRATVVGRRTFGKRVVQDITDLAGGASIFVTSGRWKTLNGPQPEANAGVEPDVWVNRSKAEEKSVSRRLAGIRNGADTPDASKDPVVLRAMREMR